MVMYSWPFSVLKIKFQAVSSVKYKLQLGKHIPVSDLP